MTIPKLPDEAWPRRKGTCEACGKVRKLGRLESWHYYCGECYGLTQEERDVMKRERRALGSKPRIAYPIVGGPLDGEHAVTADFEDRSGMYSHLSDQYVIYNCSSGGSKRIGGFPPSMIWIHRDLLKPLASPRDR